MRITDFLSNKAIIPSLKAGTKEEVLAEIVEVLAGYDSQIDKPKLVQTLLEREELGSTGIGNGVAIPHGKLDGLDHIVAGFGRSDNGIDFDSIDKKPAHLFFVLIAPRNSAVDHLKALARVSRMISDPILKNSLQAARSADEIYRLLEEYDLRMS